MPTITEMRTRATTANANRACVFGTVGGAETAGSLASPGSALRRYSAASPLTRRAPSHPLPCIFCQTLKDDGFEIARHVRRKAPVAASAHHSEPASKTSTTSVPPNGGFPSAARKVWPQRGHVGGRSTLRLPPRASLGRHIGRVPITAPVSVRPALSLDSCAIPKSITRGRFVPSPSHNHDVRRFDIAMHNSQTVRFVQGQGDLLR